MDTKMLAKELRDFKAQIVDILPDLHLMVAEKKAADEKAKKAPPAPAAQASAKT